MTRISTSSWSLHRVLGSPPLFGPGDAGPQQTSNGVISLLALPSALAQANINTLEIVHFHFPTMGQCLRGRTEGGSRGGRS